MNNADIFAPMCAFTLLVFAVWALLGYVRVSAGLGGKIPYEYLRVGTGPTPSDKIVDIHHHFSNLFEIPVLFYLACVALFVTGSVDRVVVSLAWAFVVLRVIHTGIVLINNRPQLRVTPYVLSTLAVWGLWLLLFQRALSPGA